MSSELLQSSDEWLTTEDAAKHLSVAIRTFQEIFRSGTNYYEVRRKLRGIKCKSPRGQGHLFRVGDLDAIINIRRQVRCRPVEAARVFAAQQKGLI